MSEGYKRDDAGRGSPPPESSGAADIRGGDALRSLRSHNDSPRDRNSQRERDRDRVRDRERNGERGRDRDSGRDHNRRSQDGDRDVRDRRDSGRGRHSRDRHHTRDHDRRNGYGGDDEYDSRSKARFEPRTRHHSRSRSRSKRISGFDMTSSQSAKAPDAEVQGQILGTSAAIPYPPVMPQPLSQQATRHARRVYVGGLSLTANEQSVQTFFSQVMAAIGGNTFGPGDAVVNVYLNHEKKFAFVEMRSVEEASNAITLDGIVFEGAPVKVRRPSDYNPSLAALLGPSQPNPNLNLAAVGLTLRSASGLEGSDRVFVGGLPYYVMEAQVRELLESFGTLRDFALVKDRETGNPKGYAFCIYHDLSVTDIACAALNGIRMGDKTLTVRRANQVTSQPRPEQGSVLFQAHQHLAMQSIVFQGEPATKVLCLSNVVTVEELKEDDLYEEIMEDMKGEAEKYGILVNVIIPRPSLMGEIIPGVGKVFLEYADVDGSTKARQGLHLRKFGGNEVTALYFPENTFAQGEYD